MSNSNSIDRFYDYLTNVINEIDRAVIANDRFTNNKIKKVIYCSIIESLGKAVNPHESSSANRFINLISEHSDWNDKRRYSTFLLHRTVHKYDKICKTFVDEVEKHYDILESKHSEWSDGKEICIKFDFSEIMIKSLRQKCDYDNSTQEYHIIERCRHDKIFYSNRCSLVHEFRDKLGNWEFTTHSNNPQYVSFSEGKKDKWNLLYPLAFYSKIINSIIINTKNEFLKRDTNPYDSFIWGDFVIDTLHI